MQALLDSGLALLPAKMDTPKARIIMLAITRQEDPEQRRRQMIGSPPEPKGPAAGLWQFEAGGGVVGVMSHPAVRDLTRKVCDERGVAWERRAIWEALQTDDVLACALARLLLWTDAQALPSIGAVGPAWDLYYRVWRPGRPHPEKWPLSYAWALEQ